MELATQQSPVTLVRVFLLEQCGQKFEENVRRHWKLKVYKGKKTNVVVDGRNNRAKIFFLREILTTLQPNRKILERGKLMTQEKGVENCLGNV